MKNTLLYNAALALVNAARIVKPVDSDYAQELLDKAEYFKNSIVIDEEQEKEIIDYAEKIREGLSD